MKGLIVAGIIGSICAFTFTKDFYYDSVNLGAVLIGSAIAIGIIWFLFFR